MSTPYPASKEEIAISEALSTVHVQDAISFFHYSKTNIVMFAKTIKESNATEDPSDRSSWPFVIQPPLIVLTPYVRKT